MNEERTAKVLATHADGLIGRREAIQRINMTDEERSRLAPLFQLAERLQQSMQPVKPSAAFAHSLGKELVDNAKRQIALTKRLRRATLIGAAALGSLLSIASVVGAIVFVIARSRARAQARAIHAPTGQTESAPA
jgi:hypothetical protein